ncbi:MAG TPA: hypothetical protein V6C65_08855 [Allocoleopsis sp.]
MYSIRITQGAKTKNWRGIVFGRPDIKMRDGKFSKSVVVGFCTEFVAKEDTKAFCLERGGDWHSFERYWYVPISSLAQKNGEIISSFWKIAMEGIETVGQFMNMGPAIYISVELPFDKDLEDKVVGSLNKKARIHNSNLQAIPGGKVIAFPTGEDLLITRRKPESINGVTIE